jgi:hypothetical protein
VTLQPFDGCEPGDPVEPVPSTLALHPARVRQIIDSLVDERERQNFGRFQRDATPIQVPWHAEALHQALGYPLPPGPHPPPDRVLYRRYAIVCTP